MTDEQHLAEVRRIDRALDRCARKGGQPPDVTTRYHGYMAGLGRRRAALCREMLLLDAAAYRLLRIQAEEQGAARTDAPPAEGEEAAHDAE